MAVYSGLSGLLPPPALWYGPIAKPALRKRRSEWPWLMRSTTKGALAASSSSIWHGRQWWIWGKLSSPRPPTPPSIHLLRVATPLRQQVENPYLQAFRSAPATDTRPGVKDSRLLVRRSLLPPAVGCFVRQAGQSKIPIGLLLAITTVNR